MRWEYKVSNAPTTPLELQHVLDQNGGEEWELVSTTPLATRLLLLFKRPIEYMQSAEVAEEETSEAMDTHTKVIQLPEIDDLNVNDTIV